MNRAFAGQVSRREFLATAGSALAAMSCGGLGAGPNDGSSDGNQLTARPAVPSTIASAGTSQLWSEFPSAHLVVPANLDATAALPLVVALHGAGITASGPLQFLGPYAEASKFLLLVPDSRGATWDGITGGYGP